MRFFVPCIAILCSTSVFAWAPQRAAHTGCIDRWYGADVQNVSVIMTTDKDGIGKINANQVQSELKSAMTTWNSVQCELCYDPGGSGCMPDLCASNPLGVTLQDGGIGTHTAWGVPCAALNPNGTCNGVKPNGNYVVGVTQDWPFSSAIAAQSFVVSNLDTGEIIDADILFNQVTRGDGSTFGFCSGDCAQNPSAYPLCLVLTHELGHVLGLDHSTVKSATMFPSATPDEVSKCKLSTDDTLGICTIYRTTCSGQPGEITPSKSDCVKRAEVSAPKPSVPGGCQAGRGGIGWIFGCLGLFCFSLIRRAKGRSQATRT